MIFAITETFAVLSSSAAVSWYTIKVNLRKLQYNIVENLANSAIVISFLELKFFSTEEWLRGCLHEKHVFLGTLFRK